MNKIIINPEEKYHRIGKKIYKVSKETTKKKSEHLSKIILVEVDKKEYDKRISDIVEVISDYVNKDTILTDILRDLPLSEIEMIERRIQKKVKIKEKKGCLNLMIGDYELPIIE